MKIERKILKLGQESIQAYVAGSLAVRPKQTQEDVWEIIHIPSRQILLLNGQIDLTGKIDFTGAVRSGTFSFINLGKAGRWEPSLDTAISIMGELHDWARKMGYAWEEIGSGAEDLLLIKDILQDYACNKI